MLRKVFKRALSSASAESSSQQQQQQLPLGLWIVATPIGNLGDMSERSRKALHIADVILCEDTRRTAKLLSAIGVENFMKRLQRCDAFTTQESIQKWVRTIKLGKSIALVTDSGTPAISDPGSKMVAEAVKESIKIVPVPGPSAITTLIAMSGFHDTAFTFGGFFPRKESERIKVLKAVQDSQVSRVGIWFESPNRIVDSLRIAKEVYPTNAAVVGKELTKFHEKLFHGQVRDVYQSVSNKIENEGEIGEWCFALQFEKLKEENEPIEIWMKSLDCLFDGQVALSEAVRIVVSKYDAPKKQVYDAALEMMRNRVKLR